MIIVNSHPCHFIMWQADHSLIISSAKSYKQELQLFYLHNNIFIKLIIIYITAYNQNEPHSLKATLFRFHSFYYWSLDTNMWTKMTLPHSLSHLDHVELCNSHRRVSSREEQANSSQWYLFPISDEHFRFGNLGWFGLGWSNADLIYWTRQTKFMSSWV